MPFALFPLAMSNKHDGCPPDRDSSASKCLQHGYSDYFIVFSLDIAYGITVIVL